jgi:hypothetical protein
MQAMLVTGLSQTTLVSIQVGLSTTVPMYTDVLLPPPSRFCMENYEKSRKRRVIVIR